MILYIELGVVLMMLGVTVFDLIRTVIWEIQEIIEYGIYHFLQDLMKVNSVIPKND